MNNDLISRQAAINKILGQPPEPHYPSWYAEQIKELPTAQPKTDDNLKFLEFLWNTINPNEMEQYLEMYSSKEVKSNG